jgi:hypothetical protein
MDRGDNTPADLFGALDDIRSVNRFLRGSKVLVAAAYCRGKRPVPKVSSAPSAIDGCHPSSGMRRILKPLVLSLYDP